MISEEAESPSKIDFLAFQTYLQISSSKLELFLTIVNIHPKESCQLEFQVSKMICQEAVSPSTIDFLACQRHLQMEIIKPNSKIICQEAMSPSKIVFQAFQTYLQISSTKLELFPIIVPMHSKESSQLEFQVSKMICQEAVSPSKIDFLACQRHLQMAIIKPNLILTKVLKRDVEN